MQHPTLPLTRIVAGKNPRTYFDPAKMAELIESVREHGVLQPILVRPVDNDQHAIVAGERRYRAALAAHGESYEIPVVVKEMTDAEARVLSLVENIQRADMAPSEEAISAAELVGSLRGDRGEAARVLGWSRGVLDKRLALMNCSTSVLEALNTRAILLGHAELLAALSKENQDKLLPIIVGEAKTVAELKKTIESISCTLATAIFDKADCAACPHNSELQSEMFGESIATGNCTNRACFNAKTEKQLDTVAEQMRDEYPTIRIVRAGDNHTRIQLVVDGPTGVGEDQAKACHSCQNYGAAVSGLPDSLGRVFRGQCFDTVCNTEKVAARITAERKAKQASAGEASTKQAAGSSAAKATQGPKATEKAAATSVSETDKVKAFRVALWRKALRREVGRDPALARRYVLAVALSGLGRKIDDSTIGAVWQKLTDEKSSFSDLSKAAQAVEALSDENQTNMLTGVAMAAIDGLEVPNLVQLCKHHKLDLGQHFKLSKDFLELLTKSEIMVVADEIGLRAALGDEFKKVFGKSKGEVIDALLNVKDFIYEGKVPKVIKY